ncbi:MAG: HD domain-containing protein [Faecalibacterium sp.]|nr:HD domain-containing protein [Faecalibacterium sp.]
MSSSGRWNRRASAEAPSTNQSPPLIRQSRPMINKTTGISMAFPSYTDTMRNVFLSYQIFDFIAIFCPFCPTPQKIVAQKPKTISSKEEFEVIKTHCMQGANMLRRLENFEDEPLLQTAYDIARWHHERWDGRGYPDGLKGNDIPISAQIVSLADVYDALTSERCYKKAFSHETAMRMILNGECGAFNPLLLECLTDIQAELQEKSQNIAVNH